MAQALAAVLFRPQVVARSQMPVPKRRHRPDTAEAAGALGLMQLESLDTGEVSDEGLMQQMLLESAISDMQRAGPADAPQGRDQENFLVLERLQCGHCPVWLGLLGSNVLHNSADLLSSSHYLMEDAVQLLGLGPHDAWTEPQEHLSKDEVLAAVDASFAARIS